MRKSIQPLAIAILLGSICGPKAHAEAISLNDLAKSYRQDDAKADNRFKGKRFDVSGEIESVQKDALGMLVRNVARIRAKAEPGKLQELQNLKSGQTISMSCVIDGTGFYAVEMSQCSGFKVSVAKPPVPEAKVAAPQRSGGFFPSFKNSADMQCEYGRQCSDVEFARLLADQRQKWEITPDALKVICSMQPTLARLQRCIIESSLSWLSEHPGQSANWLPGT